MKAVWLAATFVGLFFLNSRDVQAQVYDLYYYWNGSQYQQYWPQYDLYSYGNTNQYPEQLYDPYYELHVVHYQLYLPQYQAYPYVPCCFGGGVIIPVRRHVSSVIPRDAFTPPSPISPLGRFITPPPQLFRQK